MAALTIVAASVAKVSGDTRQGTAGVTITAGQALYQAADGTIQTTLSTSATRYFCIGISLHAALANQPIIYQINGTITIGATVAIGVVYVIDVGAGGGLIAPIVDQVSTWYSGSIGTATTAAIITMNLLNYGVVKA